MECIYSLFNLHFSLTRQNEASVCVLLYITASYLNSLFYNSANSIGVKFSLKFFFSILGRVANRDSKLPWLCGPVVSSGNQKENPELNSQKSLHSSQSHKVPAFFCCCCQSCTQLFAIIYHTNQLKYSKCMGLFQHGTTCHALGLNLEISSRKSLIYPGLGYVPCFVPLYHSILLISQYFSYSIFSLCLLVLIFYQTERSTVAELIPFT